MEENIFIKPSFEINICEENNMKKNQVQLRSPIVTVCGHVDHGKTSILDCFRGSFLQEEEAGGITQKISFTRFPLSRVFEACPLLHKNKVELEIPGFLFIDTPGHAAFTNLRKRGGSLADLAIVVVSIKESIQPQTVEVLQILKAHKTPFVIALNKIDTISGWRNHEGKTFRESAEMQPMHTRSEFDEAVLTFQGSLKELGFESELYYNINDFTKNVAIVPCSARTKEGISELLFILSGLCQRFLRDRLKLSEVTKGVLLELKKDRGMEWAEVIVYDGVLKEGDSLMIASFGEPVVSKARAMAEILPLSTRYTSTKELRAASGGRIQLTTKEGVLPGMPFQVISENKEKEKVRAQFKKEFSEVLKLDKQGIVLKADSLGSLEALMTLLRQERVPFVKAGIGPIGKGDLLSAQANIDIDPLNAVVLGFNVSIDEGLNVPAGVKVMTHPVVYKLIEEVTLWRKDRQEELVRERLLGLATICKLDILNQHVFRNSNPAIFGVRVSAGKIRVGIPLIDSDGEEVARVKSLQLEKESVNEAVEGKELAMALPGIMFDRRLGKIDSLYADLSESQFRQIMKQKDLFSHREIKVLEELAAIKRKKNSHWGY
ncbi:translation initiation factor IF-2 [Candidatus Pacearchaeota archaeon]|nr:translation initiation factor IF-2 [Candidatus Pacearchaeota archaeon]